VGKIQPQWFASIPRMWLQLYCYRGYAAVILQHLVLDTALEREFSSNNSCVRAVGWRGKDR